MKSVMMIGHHPTWHCVEFRVVANFGNLEIRRRGLVPEMLENDRRFYHPNSTKRAPRSISLFAQLLLILICKIFCTDAGMAEQK